MNNLSFSGAAAAISSVTGSSAGTSAPVTVPTAVADSVSGPAVQVSLASVAPSTSNPENPTSASVSATNSDTTASAAQPVPHAIRQLNHYLQSVNLELNYTQDPQGTHFVQVIDSKTHQVIRQIPDQVAIALAEDISLQMMSRAAGKNR